MPLRSVTVYCRIFIPCCDCGLLFEGDGETWQWREGNALWLRWEIRADSQRIDVTFTSEGRAAPTVY
ncbi:hypothetical protein BV916_11005 [Pectobacterium odoriferum]|nr:hypothetical protein BV916_11005 [Pectobacterium odoriferum]